jgi:uncharacterized membrane protein
MWQDHQLVVLLGASSAANGINEHGVIVGNAATIWHEGAAANLNELLCEPLPGRVALSQAKDINERGEIVTDAVDPGQFLQGRAMILTPVLGPEGCEQ